MRSMFGPRRISGGRGLYQAVRAARPSSSTAAVLSRRIPAGGIWRAGLCGGGVYWLRMPECVHDAIRWRQLTEACYGARFTGMGARVHGLHSYLCRIRISEMGVRAPCARGRRDAHLHFVATRTGVHGGSGCCSRSERLFRACSASRAHERRPSSRRMLRHARCVRFAILRELDTYSGNVRGGVGKHAPRRVGIAENGDLLGLSSGSSRRCLSHDCCMPRVELNGKVLGLPTDGRAQPSLTQDL